MAHIDYLQIWDNRPMSGTVKKCVNRLRQLAELFGDTYTMITIPAYDNIVNTVNESDRVRFEWLAEHPHGCYVDTDCYLNKRLDMPDDCRVYLPLFCDMPDIFIVYVNNNTGYIRQYFDKPRRIKGEFYGMGYHYLKSLTGYGIIPDEYYKHYHTTISGLVEKKMEGGRMNGNSSQGKGDVSLDSVCVDLIDGIAQMRRNLITAKRQIFELQNRLAVYEKAEKTAVPQYTNVD